MHPVDVGLFPANLGSVLLVGLFYRERPVHYTESQSTNLPIIAVGGRSPAQRTRRP